MDNNNPQPVPDTQPAAAPLPASGPLSENRVPVSPVSNTPPPAHRFPPKKAFLLGALLIFIFSLVIFYVAYFLIRQRTHPVPKATSESVVSLNCNGDYTGHKYSFSNKADCLALKCGGSSGNLYACGQGGGLAGTCNGNCSRPIGGCGVLQLDGVKDKGCDDADIGWDCSACPSGGIEIPSFVPPILPQVPPLKCKGITMTGGSDVVTGGGSQRTLTAKAEGGTGKITIQWTVKSKEGEAGTLSKNRGEETVWTAPANLTKDQKWTIRAVAMDSNGNKDSGSCVQTLSFTPAVVYTHNVCTNNACVVTNCDPVTTQCAKPTDCKTDSDCRTVTHKECQNNACKILTGAGTDSCTTDADCAPATHKECRNNACVNVTGTGNNACNTDGDCVVATHKICQNEACVSVSGAGVSSCYTDNDCKVAVVTHKECQDGACKVVTGAGTESCTNDSDCVAVTHKECRNNACVPVSGAGSDKCASDESCRPVLPLPPVPVTGDTALSIVGAAVGVGALLLGLLLVL